MKNYDLIAIGDTVIDAFIKLKEAEVKGSPDSTDYKICIPFAEKVPYDDVVVIPAVGNAANGAVSSARLGLKTAIITNIGKDRNGEDCLESFKKDGVKTEFVKINDDIKTNYHYVLSYDAERTILIKHEKYSYSMPDIGTPSWIYFSSVGEHAFPFHNTVADYLEKNPSINLAFQPGKNEIKLGKEKMARLYKQAKLFFCNVEEANKILESTISDKKELLKAVRALGPQTVVITDGPKGSYAYDGAEFWYMPLYPDPKPPVERTGAGDAFSSTTVAAISLGKTLPEAMAWGGINSMSVVQDIGAQRGLLSREKIEEYLAKAPADYKAKKLD